MNDVMVGSATDQECTLLGKRGRGGSGGAAGSSASDSEDERHHHADVMKRRHALENGVGGQQEETTQAAQQEAALKGLLLALTATEAKLIFGPRPSSRAAQTSITTSNGHQVLAPLRFLTAFETAVVCTLDRVEDLHGDRAVHNATTRKLTAELHRIFDDEERASRELRAAQEAHASKIAHRTAKAVFRRWSHAASTFKMQMRVSFDVYRARQARERQDEMLRDTESLTRRLITSVVQQAVRQQPRDEEASDRLRCESRGRKRGVDGQSRDALTSPHALPDDAPDESSCASAQPSSLELDILGGGREDRAFEGQLRLLNTLDGARPLRDYQRSALRWMINLYSHNLNGILADEMGLGKTVQTIALLAYFAEYKRDWGPHIVVVPTTVVLNWELEFRRWLPGFKCLSYIGSAAARRRLRQGWTQEGAFNVVITSYGVVCRDRAVFRRRPWGFLILDEAHTIKNWASQKWQALFDFQAEYRLLLTGTPLQNSVMELWSLFHFLLPSLSAFESNEQFREWFSDPLNEMVAGNAGVNEELIKRMHALFRPFLLRRLKKDVETQLPQKVERVILCPLSKRQRSLYSGYMSLSRTRSMLWRGGFTGALGVVLALRKVCDHPELFAERPTISPFLLAGEGHEVLLQMPRPVFLLANCLGLGCSVGRPMPRALQSTLIFAHSLQREGPWRFVHDCGGFAMHQLLPEGPSMESAAALSSADHLTFASNDTLFDYVSLMALHDLLWDGDFSPSGDQAEGQAQLSAQELRVRVLLDNSPRFFGEAGTATRGFWADMANAHWRAVRERELARRQIMRCRQQQLRSRVASMLQFFLVAGRIRRDVWPRLPRQSLVTRFPGLVPTVPQRFHAARAIVHKFAVYVPKCRTQNGPGVVCRLPVPHFRPFRLPTRRDLHHLLGIAQPPTTMHSAACYTAKHFAAEGWALHNRGCFNFPEKTLIIHDAGKLQVLAPLLKQLVREGHRALIFTQFTAMLGILEKFLALLGLKYLRLDGATKPEVRQQLVERFNSDSDFSVMILSTRSGGIGINLTGADTVIFYDSDWNPTMDLQAQDRVHRIGQTKPVTVYRLVSEGTVEERILQKARERKKLNNVVIRGGAFHKGVDGIAEAVEDASSAPGAVASAEGDTEAAAAASTTAFLFSSVGNIRDFFHDFDEDYEPQGDCEPAPGMGALSTLEDAEDVEAQHAVEAELRHQVDEEELMDEFSGGIRSGPLKEQQQQGMVETDETPEMRAVRRRKAEIAARSCQTAGDAFMLRVYGAMHKKEARRCFTVLKEEYKGLDAQPSFEEAVAHCN